MAISRNTEKEFVSCVSCARAILMQWFQNPIVAFCKEKQERVVAQSRRVCSDFEPNPDPSPEVRHFDCYDDHQVDFLKEYIEE